MRPLFGNVLHIEGMDLAGKSTATRAFLRAHPGAAQRRNSLVERNPVYDLADTMRRSGQASPEVLGDLYVASLAHEIETARPPAGVGVQDSTILLRSLAYNSVIGAAGVVQRLESLTGKHPRFGLTVVLTADIPSRIARLQERQRLAPEEVAADDLLVISAPDQFLAMERVLVAYAESHFGAIVIDTSQLQPCEVAEAVLARWTGRPA